MASVILYRGATFAQVRLETPIQHGKPPKRGEVKSFSERSRRRMIQTMNKLRRDELPIMVTLTYPNDFPEYREDYKRHLECFGRRLRRRWPLAFIIWKLEFKIRKSGANKGKVAPHYHLFIYNVPIRFPFRSECGAWFRLVLDSRKEFADTAGIWMEYVDGNQPNGTSTGPKLSRIAQAKERGPQGNLINQEDSLKHWVSRNWYDIVGSADPRHYRAGTKVEIPRNYRHMMAYAAKRYIAKADLPDEVREAPGRFWGMMGRQNAPLGRREVLDLRPGQACQLRRLIRRHRRATTKPEKRRFLRSRTFRERDFCVTAFVDVEQWMRAIEAIRSTPSGEPRAQRRFAPDCDTGNMCLLKCR